MGSCFFAAGLCFLALVFFALVFFAADFFFVVTFFAIEASSFFSRRLLIGLATDLHNVPDNTLTTAERIGVARIWIVATDKSMLSFFDRQEKRWPFRVLSRLQPEILHGAQGRALERRSHPTADE